MIPNETSKIRCSWYLPPERTVIEAGVVWALVLLYFREWAAGRSGFNDWQPGEGYSRTITPRDWALGFVCALDSVVLLFTKWIRGRMWFLLQPCNMWPFLLTYICLSTSGLAVWLFNFYLHVMWGSFLGAIAADLRDYTTSAEVVFFFVHHAVIMFVPVVCLVEDIFPVYPLELNGTYAVTLAQHWMVYLPVSVVTGWHIQYMMHPPKQLRGMERNYRIVMLVGAWGMTWWTHTITMMLSGMHSYSFEALDVVACLAFPVCLIVTVVCKPSRNSKNY